MHRLLCWILILLSFSLSAQSQVESGNKQIPDTVQARVDTLLKYVRKEFYKKNYDRTLELGEEALDLAYEIKDYKSAHRISSLMGNAFLQTNDTLQAKRIFTESLKAAEKRKDSYSILGSRIDLGNIYAIQKDYDPAITIFKETIPFAKKLNDTIRLFILNYNIAELYLDKKNLKQANTYVYETQKYVTNLRAKSYQAGFELLIGRLKFLEGKPKEAIRHFEKNVQWAKEADFIDGIIEGLDYYAKSEAANGNFKKAYNMQQEVEQYRSEKYKTDKIEAIETVTARFNLEQYKQELKATELQNELAEQKASRSSTILVWTLLAAGLLCIFLLSLLVSYRKRKVLLEDLKDKNKKYLTAKDKSEQLSSAKVKFFSNISHELRTPLYGIIGISSLLMEDEDLEKHKDDVKSLKFSADYLLALINDVLQLNKLDATKNNELNNAPFNLKELVESIIKSFEFMRLQNNNIFDVNIHEGVPHFLNGDRVKLSQILMNLIGNACKFTENGAITLNVTPYRVDQQTLRIAFEVNDTGIGISKEKQKYIFDEFTQVSNKSIYQGTGLGLPIVKKLLELHGSKIELESEVGAGTQFSFDIEYRIADEKSMEVIATSVSPETTMEGKRIMVVDDNRINLIVTQKMLDKHGAVTFTANNGQECINMLKENTVDLVLMDINMPGMNGFETTQGIRTFNQEIPIIALTAVEIEEMSQKIYASGMNDIIVKPYDLNVFINTILSNITKN